MIEELNVDQLRLTDQEIADAVTDAITDLGESKEPMSRAVLDKRIADAQVTKALRNIALQIEATDGPIGNSPGPLWDIGFWSGIRIIGKWIARGAGDQDDHQ